MTRARVRCACALLLACMALGLWELHGLRGWYEQAGLLQVQEELLQLQSEARQAAGEAEAELASMNMHHVIDAILTDDSDIDACTPISYYLLNGLLLYTQE